MVKKNRNVIKSIVERLFKEEHNPLEAMGLSIEAINEWVEKVDFSDKVAIDNIKHDIDFALEFTEVLSDKEKMNLERLKLKLVQGYTK